MNVNPNIRVSVIIPCYNYGSFLAECLDSIRAQSYKQWECIIVDNTSTDNTKEIALKYTRSDERIKYIFTEVIIPEFIPVFTPRQDMHE